MQRPRACVAVRASSFTHAGFGVWIEAQHLFVHLWTNMEPTERKLTGEHQIELGSQSYRPQLNLLNVGNVNSYIFGGEEVPCLLTITSS